MPDELEGASRMVIYPSINMLLLGEDARALVDTFRDAEDAPESDMYYVSEG